MQRKQQFLKANLKAYYNLVLKNFKYKQFIVYDVTVDDAAIEEPPTKKKKKAAKKAQNAELAEAGLYVFIEGKFMC